jgi:hypothetical protein
MKFRTQSLTRAILATGVVAAFSLSQMAVAEEARGELTINAGLSEALTVSCTPLDFGVTRVDPSANQTGVLTILAEDGGTPNLADTPVGLTADSGSSAECEISGSQAGPDSPVTVQFFAENTGGTLLTPDAINLTFEGAPAEFKITQLTTSPDIKINGSGGSTFYIGGSLNIPATLLSTDMGAYSTSIFVQVTDGSD